MGSVWGKVIVWDSITMLFDKNNAKSSIKSYKFKSY